jgi:histone H3/H4
MNDPDTWMVCSACRKPIGFGATHWVCSVSTCNRQRTRLVFCSVGCWDSHLSVLRHRDAWAVEARAPSRAEWQASEDASDDDEDDIHDRPTPGPTPMPMRNMPPPPTRRVVETGSSASSAASEDDVLIVVSRMKKYIRDKSGFNTSDAVAVALSEHVRAICDEAIRTAAADGRKTVLDRDVPRVRRS